jgi:hypothetical protein
VDRCSRIRASDQDRDEIAQLVWTAAADGELATDEGAERIDRAYAAVYRDELRALVADLPVSEPWRPGSTSWVLHLAGALLFAALAMGIWMCRGASSFWPALPAAMLTAGFATHAAAMRAAELPVPARDDVRG